MSKPRKNEEVDDQMRNIGDEEEEDYQGQVEEEEDGNNQVEEDDEEEEDDDEQDDYQQDGFVVGDSEEEEIEEEEDEDAEERRRRKKEKKRQKKLEKQNQHRRILKKGPKKRELSEDEMENNEIQDLEEYHEDSEEGIPDRKRNQQSRTGNDGHQGDKMDLEDQGNEDYLEDVGDYGAKYGKTAFEELFMDDESGEEEQNENEDDENREVDDYIDVQQLFEPDDLKKRFERDDDKKIKEEDIPERLQIRMQGRKAPDPEELMEETKWISEKIKTIKDYKGSKKLNDINFHSKIFSFLQSLHLDKEEVMYIYTYKKNEFHPQFDLEDLWRLYDLDGEWAQFNRQKNRILLQIQQLRRELENTPLLIQNNIIDFEQVRKVEEFFHKAIDTQSLKFIKEYFDYLFIKIYPQKEHQRLKIRKDRKTRMINTYIQCKVHKLVSTLTLSPQDLVKNLEEMNQINQPQLQQNKPQAYADNLISENPNVPCMKEAIEALECMVDYLSNELFNYPPLKKWYYEMFKQKCLISTEPTDLGKKQIDMFHPLYPAKRIHKRPYTSFTDDTWLLLEEAERLNFITVKIFLKSENDNNSDNNSIFDIMSKNYMISLKNLEAQIKQINSEWNFFRKYNIENVCDKFFLPYAQSLVRIELHENAEKWVVSQCQQKFYNMINVEPQKNGKIMSVVQDTNGRIGVVFVDENGIPNNSMILNYFTKKEDQLSTKARLEKTQEEHELEIKFKSFGPQLIVVAANSIESQRLKNLLHQKYEKSQSYIQYGDDTIPQIVAKQPTIQGPGNTLQFKDSVLRVALSQGRILLNPTAEILSLWNDNVQQNGCLHIPLHPSQEYISLDKLQYSLEKCCVQIVNFMGVEMDMLQDQPHLKHLLQHVCGLGPRKALKLIELLEKNAVIFEKEKEVPKKRGLLITQLDIKDVVFKNINGFIRFRFSKDPIEKTRINKDLYKIAKKICRDSADNFQIKSQSDEDIVEYVMKNPKYIDAMDLEDYAQQLEEMKNQPNMAPVLDFVKDELINPFSYKRNTYEAISDQDLFFKMIKESPQTFRKGMIVSAKIIQIRPKENQQIKQHQLLVKIVDNDLKSSILVSEEESKNYKVGDIIKAYVDQIFVLDNKRSKDKIIGFDVNCVTLTFKAIKFNDLVREMRQFQDLDILSTFKFIEAEDKPLGIDVTERKAKKFEPRKIAHPNFKNISITDAVKLLKNAKNGEFIIRPSSKGKQYLAITWKFFDDVFVHLSLKEEYGKEKGFQTKYVLNDKESFDNFDEIIERYIIPCNNHMNSAKDNRKFSKKSIEEIEQELKRNKEEQPDIIHYNFCCVPKYPQFIVLLYCSKQDQVTKEWIKVKYQGFYFHEKYFGQLKDLIKWFKDCFHTPEYKKYVKKAEEPYASKTPSSFSNQGTIGIKQEGGVKYEKSERGIGGQKCQNCGKYGHAANNCKNKRSYNSSSGQGSASGAKQCFHCKGTDHFIKDCPNKTHQSNKGSGGFSYSRRDRNQQHSRSRSRSYDNEH
ncbi:zinc knuckle protein (macronuclear) [Tetrahymena thermophila SB210]|uniref:Zinc knuckle protein n=1 Tax=Tetrahymena thermophila (strain SB210) TaxID=312017 RepID=Q22BP0_TETTS|nr:zinc knuckle protein [Tetrahymena thermophila SB210]EAR82689.2 zinc knuckle protein [Tetrahymena thermophila SB210]|eukprot:XP_001030352.2 zinc knuckle protein [Tetrahymena thermophila SB210]